MEKLFKALASEPRRRILSYLLEGPMTVGEIGDYFEMALPSISSHLAILKESGVVRERRQGQYRLYSIEKDVLANGLLAFLAPYDDEAGRIAEERNLMGRKGRQRREV